MSAVNAQFEVYVFTLQPPIDRALFAKKRHAVTQWHMTAAGKKTEGLFALLLGTTPS